MNFTSTSSFKHRFRILTLVCIFFACCNNELHAQCVAQSNSVTAPACGGTTTISGSAGGMQSWSVPTVNGAYYTVSISAGSNGCGSYSVTPTSFTGNGSNQVISIYAGGSCCWAASGTSATLSYTRPNPTSSLSGGTTPICSSSGAGGTLTCTAGAGSGTFAYQWANGGGSIGSATNSTYSPTGLTSSQTYNCSVTSAGCTVNSGTSTITVVTTPSGATVPTVNYCSNTGSGTVAVSGGSSATQYSWSLPSGLTGSSTTSSIGVTGSTAGAYVVTVTPQDVASGTTCNGAAVNGTVNIVKSASGGTVATVTACNGVATPVTISGASNATQYAWALPSGLSGSSTAATINVTGTTVSSYTVSVTPQDVGSGITCPSSTQITGTVSVVATEAAPTLSGTPSPSNASAVCGNYGNITANVNAGSGGSGASDAYQYSINGGTSYTSVTPSAGVITIPTAGATGNIILQAERSGGLCSTVGWNTLYTWTYQTAPIAPVLSGTPSPSNASAVCANYGNLTANVTAGSGGGSGATDNYQYSLNGGTSYTSVSAVSGVVTIPTAGATGSIILQAERTGGTNCSTVGWNTLYTWTFQTAPTAPVLSGTPSPSNASAVCANYGNITANVTAGSGGGSGATDNYQYSLNGGTSYTPVSAVSGVVTIPTAGATGSIILQAERTGGTNCTTVGWNTLYTWTFQTAPTAPVLSGTPSPSNASAVCANYGNITANVTAGSGGGTGATDNYQYSINGGTSYTSTTPSGGVITIPTAGATGSIILQAERTGGTNCSTVGWNTLYTWTLQTAPTAPVLSGTPSPSNASAICANYGNLTANITAGSGGGTGAADSYQYSINGGSSYASVTPSAGVITIPTAGATGSIILQAERTGGTNCTTVGWNTLYTWTLQTAPVAPTLNGTPTPPPSGGTCVSYGTLSVPVTAGSGGGTGAADAYQYSINGGSTYSSVTASAGVVSIPTAGATTSIILQAERTGGTNCTTVGWNTLATWTIYPPVSNYGTITASVATTQYLCSSRTPAGTFSVTGAAGGAGTFSYQWYSQAGIITTPGSSIPGSWTIIGGATNATYAPAGTTSSISYACVVTPTGVPSCAGTATWASGVLNFTVSTPTSFITGGNDTLCVTATGTNVLTASTTYTATWQWQSSTDDLTFADITGATSPTYSAPTSTVGELYYHAIATYSSSSGCSPAISNNEYVDVVAQPTITSQPGSLSMCQGGTGDLAVTFTGGAGATYQWETNYGAGYTAVSDNNPNAPGITYGGTGTQNPVAISSSGTSYTGTLPYKVIIYFSAAGCTASIPSSPGSATISPQVVINTQPASSTSICAGSNTSLSVTATPGFTLSYEWQYYNTSTSSWADVVNSTPAGFGYTTSGSTLNITTTNGTTPAGSYQYQCIVHSTGSDCNPVTSSPGTIVITAHPTAFTPTVSSNPVCITSTGGGTNIQVAASQSSVNYQLQNVVGPTNIGSAVAGTGGSINLPTGNITASTTYQVVATTSTGGCTTTSTVQDTVVAVNPDIAIGAQLTGTHYTFGTIGSPALPTGWSNPTTGGLQWTLATTTPATGGSYSYYNGSGGTSAASTGAYITTPTGASTTTVSLISGTINTTGYSNISVQWGAHKSAGYAGTVNLYYSTDNGATWSSAVSFTDVQDNLTGSPWVLTNNGVQVKLPAAASNQATLKLKWTAGAAGSGIYYSMNDIGVYGLSTITNCGNTSISLPYLNSSCGASKYNIGTSTVAGVGSTWPSLATVTNGTLPSSPVSITVPATTASGTYDVDFTVNDGAGHSSGTINFPVTTDPAITVTATLDNCSCANTSSVFGNIVTVYATGGSGVFYFNSAQVVDTLKSTIDASDIDHAGTTNHSGVKGIFWSKADGGTHSYTVSDGYCTVTPTKVTQSTTPTAIPFGSATGVPTAAGGLFGGGNGIHGSFNSTGQGDPSISTPAGSALTCHQTADFGNSWVTYQVNSTDTNNNKAVVEINNNGFNLDSVSVSVYRDATLPEIPNSAQYTTACAGYQGYALERHFMVKSTKSTGANSFSTPVGVRLYFSDAEFQDLKYWTMHVATTATGQTAGCAYLDTVTNMNSIYVTKYTGTNEDGNYLNNQAAPTGLYRVFGKNAASNGNSPLTAIDGGGATLTTGGTTNLHYVQMNVTEFSEFWLGGSSGGDALPVEMMYLQAEALNNDSIQVSWATASEINNHEFDVERSTDATNWSTIAIVPGHDNSTQENDYAYNDLDVVPGITYYYRLKQVDNNGNYQYTDVVQAKLTGNGTFTVMNFVPNPTAGNTNLTVIATKTQEITVDFYDMLGQRVLSATEQLVPGNNVIPFNLSRFASGTYSAVVTSENQLYTKKIVVTR